MRFLIAALLLVPAIPSMSAQEAWREMKAPHYRVLSQLNDRETANWVRQYDQFIASTSTMLNINLKSLPPLTVVLFSRDRDFVPYKIPRPDGKTANVAGQFIRQPSWSVIGLAENLDDENTRQTIFHEGTHWLMSVDPSRQPPWFTEGIAELFSTFERKGSTVNWAKPIEWHLYQLNRFGTMPLQEFLTQDSAIFDRDDHTGRFYAQSWAFVHFMLVSNDPARREMLTRYLNTFRTNSSEATIEATIGSGLSDLQRAFDKYVDQPKYAYVTKPVVPIAEPLPMTAARPADVETALAFLAMGAAKKELVRQHVTRALELDRSLPGPHEVLAYLARAENEVDQAATHADAALGNGSKDADMFLILGDSYRFGANSEKKSAELTAVRMYENAINLNPRRLAAFERLVEALFVVESPTPEDAKFLSLGVKAFPDEDWIRVGVASVAYRQGQRDTALAGIDKALRSNGTLDGARRKHATGLRNHWYLDEANTEVQAAVENREFAAALKSLESCRSRIAGDPEAEARLQSLQDHVETLHSLDLASEARKAGRKSEANAILDKLLQRPDLPAEMRRYIEQSRRK